MLISRQVEMEEDRKQEKENRKREKEERKQRAKEEKAQLKEEKREKREARKREKAQALEELQELPQVDEGAGEALICGPRVEECVQAPGQPVNLQAMHETEVPEGAIGEIPREIEGTGGNEKGLAAAIEEGVGEKAATPAGPGRKPWFRLSMPSPDYCRLGWAFSVHGLPSAAAAC